MGNVTCPICRGHAKWACSDCPQKMLDETTAAVSRTVRRLELKLGWPDEDKPGWLHQPAGLLEAVEAYRRFGGV
jgi:hypothetical protein